MSYAYDNKGDLGARLLWVCELAIDVPSLHGSQASLMSVSPWAGAFPWEFPNAYHDYAENILPGQGPKGLLDLQRGDLFTELLITLPAITLTVLDVVELPDEKHKAESLVRDKFHC